ncbi:MAG TPA: TetR/AcrR family transcriptional regulator [Solirubrobacterales bacterium]|jgi:AcrR family transcriptional regulator|nr:TetR/AcrR family transcriptional regulator [Solirubrobacterales bacterium]
MVDTPWGASESLRSRMLPPGPGTPAKDVAQNQRERLFGAMVASVATRGYAATRVTDLIKLSGVSRRSFYDLFPDKEACFRAVVRELVSKSLSAAAEVDGNGSERARRRFQALTKVVVAQPAAARLCLVEAFAAGEEAVAPLEEARVALERQLQAGAAESPQRAGMPPEMISALLGAALEVVRTRLRQGREAELTELGPGLVDFLLGYEAPPAPLRLATRPPTPAPETIGGHDHGERALRALAVVVAERGYANTTIDQVVKRASMSPTTFYANFDGKQDALRAAIDSAGAQITAAVLPAFRRQPDWPSAVRAAIGALFNFLASRPALAHLVMVDVYAAGPEALERREAALRPLGAILEAGRQRGPQVPPIAFEAILGGIYWLANRQVRESGSAGLPPLAPLCAYLALAPFIGAAEATEAANGDGRSRTTPDLLEGSIRERAKVLYVLERLGRRASPEEVSRELELPSAEVERQLEELEQTGLVKLVEETGSGEDAERFYRPEMPIIGTEEWGEIALPEREKISAHIGYIVLEEISQSVRAGLFDARSERFLVHVPALVDEQGWLELATIHEQLLNASLEAVARAQERLRGSGEEGLDVRSVQTLFEVPKRPD